MKNWGTNKYGQTIKEHDKLKCGSGRDTWFTHVQFDNGKWHREQDYYTGIRVGTYNKISKTKWKTT